MPSQQLALYCIWRGLWSLSASRMWDTAILVCSVLFSDQHTGPQCVWQFVVSSVAFNSWCPAEHPYLFKAPLRTAEKEFSTVACMLPQYPWQACATEAGQ